MADEKNMMSVSDSFRLRMDVTGLMLKGAGYAALLVIGIWLFVYVIHLIGKLLPADSKAASDPTPLSYWIEGLQSLPFV